MARWDFVQVKLSDIEYVDPSQLKESRLNTLLNGYEPFDKVLNSESDPIALDMSSKPYRISDGRHRIHLARKKGYTEVRAVSA
jgi:hypothetical protein